MNTASPIDSLHHPWLDRLVAEPPKAVDTLLRGVTHLPALQRASPSEALLALLGDLPPEAPEWDFLDQALRGWLESRRKAADSLLDRPGGMERFIRETGEALRAAWRLKLPKSSDWIRAELLDLLRWANGLSVDATFDLGRAVLTAAAHLQQGSELRFVWLRICEEAATPRLRHRLDIALFGLATTPGIAAGGPSHDLIVGLARWAARLPRTDHARGEVVREWRAIKAAFPRQPAFWRREWQAILDDERTAVHPFTEWLKNKDTDLQTPVNTAQRHRVPELPKNIQEIIDGLERKYQEQGLLPPLWRQMSELLDQLERYADAAGESYYLVTSCTRIAGIIMDQAPGHALALTRRTLLWTPSNGHAWAVRATALDRLGHPDLAEVVRWEAVRRIPSNMAPYCDLALAWVDQGKFAEAETLLRKAALLNPNSGPIFVELARLLWLKERTEDAIHLLYEFLGRKENDVAIYGCKEFGVALYTLGCLQVAEGRKSKAAEALDHYHREFGRDANAVTLERLIADGVAGRKEVREHLRQQRRQGGVVQGVEWDVEQAERTLAAEQAELPKLSRIARVSQADLLFRLGDTRRADALQLVDAALADPSDGYAQVVKGLAMPEYHAEMVERTGRWFSGSLPVRLALTPNGAGADYWNVLAERFPEEQHLTRLVQLARGEEGDTITSTLSDWCKEPTRWDNGWESYLKATLHRYLEGEEQSIHLDTLVHDALIQAVDVGLDATPLVA